MSRFRLPGPLGMGAPINLAALDGFTLFVPGPLLGNGVVARPPAPLVKPVHDPVAYQPPIPSAGPGGGASASDEASVTVGASSAAAVSAVPTQVAGDSADSPTAGQPATISDSVGRNGANRSDDVRTIQRLLNQAGANPALTVDGVCGSKTRRAIVAFQSRIMRSPDGRVDPGRNTLRQLNRAATGSPIEALPGTSGTPSSTPPAPIVSEPAATPPPARPGARASSGVDDSGQYTTIDISEARLLTFCQQTMDGHMSYIWGGKANLNQAPADINGLDCSGFIQYLFFKLTDGKVKLTQGSWGQQDYFKKNNFQAAPYSDCAKIDGVLRFCYLPKSGDKAAHVWLVRNARTIESSGGKGPNRRAWNTSALVSRVRDCWVVSSMVSSVLDHRE